MTRISSILKFCISIAVAIAIFIVPAAPSAYASTVLYTQDTINAYTHVPDSGSNDFVLSALNSNYFTVDLPGSQLSQAGLYFSDVYFAFTGATNGSEILSLSVTCYTASNFTTPCGTSTATTSLGAARSYVGQPVQFHLLDQASVISNASYYYRFTISTNNTWGGYFAYPAFNKYLSGLNWRSHGAFYTPTPYQLSSYGTPYLIVVSNDLGSNQTELRTISLPQQDAVTPVSTRFYFTWWYSGDSNNTAGVQITDITSPSSLYSPDQAAVSSGLNTYDQYISLTNNHLYQWRPYIYSSSTGTYIYGQRYRFSVGTQQSPFVNASTSINSSLGLTASDTELINILIGGLKIGTTTSGTGIPAIDTIEQATGRIKYAFPLDYIFDTLVLFSDLADGYNSTSTGNATWSYSNGVATTTLVVIDSDTVGSIGLIVLMKSILAMMVYTGWALLVPRFMIRLIN